MKVFVWERIEKCTNHYHSEGGVIVFAKTEERAREIANKMDGCAIKDNEKPDDVRDVTGGEEAVYIMPDAGCC
jgi:superfamily II DNA or RNA helicase